MNTSLKFLSDKSVLVTGGTGSFGSTFVEKLLLNTSTPRIVVFSRDEMKQSEMAKNIDPSNLDRVRFFLGDIRDYDRLEMALNGIDFVIHAAALKQVPAAEYNPTECIRTNVNGAENIVRASIKCGVERVLALSTDKAVNPANLYGASKLASDKVFIASNQLAGKAATKLSVVRYGNVIGSRGSVVSLFQQLIEANKDTLPITDPRMTRFWITIQQGVSFTLHALSEMNGGEIFVPKIPSMQIIDVAKAMAPNCKTEVVGIRPGEKLHEIMISEDDARYCIELDDRFIILPPWLVTKTKSLWPQATFVSEDFTYTSNHNKDWLTQESFLSLISG